MLAAEQWAEHRKVSALCLFGGNKEVLCDVYVLQMDQLVNWIADSSAAVPFNISIPRHALVSFVFVFVLQPESHMSRCSHTPRLCLFDPIAHSLMPNSTSCVAGRRRWHVSLNGMGNQYAPMIFQCRVACGERELTVICVFICVCVVGLSGNPIGCQRGDAAKSEPLSVFDTSVVVMTYRCVVSMR